MSRKYRDSCGFRPKRSAHQAVEDVQKHLLQGKTDVIDADISKYCSMDSICESCWRKIIGKPCAGKLHARN